VLLSPGGCNATPRFPQWRPSNTYDRSLVEAFQEGLRQVGLVENQNIVLDVIWSGNDPDHAVTEALRRGAELLITSGSSGIGGGEASDLDYSHCFPQCR
jgi:hypothetical protein